MEKKLSIVIPVYNEEKMVLKSLPPILKLPINKEVIIIDDGSKDTTVQLLQELQSKYQFKLLIQEINKGKGAAVRKGLKNISGDFFIICDADLEYNPNDIVSLFKEIQNYDQAKEKTALYGSRFLLNKKLSFHYLVNTFLTRLTNLLFSTHLSDMETCFKLIPTKALNEVELKSDHFEIEPEITAQLIKNGYQIKEIQISYNRRGYSEGKKIKAKDGLMAIQKIISQRFNR
ncbi:MAG TPA: glycosyltransferase family 2 protein [Patescibacteria group bacterium]|nr:glycosyltransferase family 2 protein [Patescibacteria group bacterium]